VKEKPCDWVLTKTLYYSKSPRTKVDMVILHGTQAEVLKVLKLSEPRLFEMKAHGGFSFKDSRGRTVTIELKKKVTQ
jgi:hypothetical protein